MTSIARFCILILCVGLVMICYPDFNAAGWTFAGTIILVWTGIIIIMSLIGNLFGLYRFDGINRFLTFVFTLAVIGALLWLFPQEDHVSPINKLKYGEVPTGADIQRGLQKFTFNFAFDKRNARSDQNFVNQKDAKEAAQQAALEAAKKEAAEKARRAAEKAKQKLEIIVEDR